MTFSGTDETITCKDCRQPFIFSVDEQKWFAEKDFKEKPKRCKPCRQNKRNRAGGQQPSGGYNQSGGYNAQPAQPQSWQQDDNTPRRGRRRRDDDDGADW